jgi:hypothetical protein
MKRTDAEIEIMSEWRKWRAIHVADGKTPSGTEALIFFGHLQQTRPDLVAFRHSGHKYQLVKGWLSRRREIKD